MGSKENANEPADGGPGGAEVPEVEGAAPNKRLSAPARRALLEAAERRRRAARAAQELPPEIDGAKGPEPTRYGDWERKGRISDF